MTSAGAANNQDASSEVQGHWQQYGKLIYRCWIVVWRCTFALVHVRPSTCSAC